MLKSSSLHMFLRWNISVDACARELFKPSKDSASPCVCNEKNIFGFKFHIQKYFYIPQLQKSLFGVKPHDTNDVRQHEYGQKQSLGGKIVDISFIQIITYSGSTHKNLANWLRLTGFICDPKVSLKQATACTAVPVTYHSTHVGEWCECLQLSLYLSNNQIKIHFFSPSKAEI